MDTMGSTHEVPSPDSAGGTEQRGRQMVVASVGCPAEDETDPNDPMPKPDVPGWTAVIDRSSIGRRGWPLEA